MSKSNSEIKHLSKSQILSLYDGARRTKMAFRNETILRVAYLHGLRASEVGLIRLSDVNLEERKIYIRRLKDSNSGYHPIQTQEWIPIKKQIKKQEILNLPFLFTSKLKQPISRIQLHKIIHECASFVGMEDINFHMLRHSCAVHMCLDKIPTVNVMNWLGHKKISSTQIYTEMAASIMVEDLILNCWAK